MDENLNNNKEVSEALEEINLNQQAIEQKRSTIDSDEAARKVQEALREFELQQQTLREKQQPTEVPKPQGESLNAKADIEMDKLLTEFEVKSAVEQKQKKNHKGSKYPRRRFIDGETCNENFWWFNKRKKTSKFCSFDLCFAGIFSLWLFFLYRVKRECSKDPTDSFFYVG